MVEGEILGWLNSDDIYLPGALRAAADAFRAHPQTGLLYGDANYCDTAGAVIGRYRTDAFDLDKLAWSNYICQPSAFFRREVFEAVGGLDETLHFVMDYDLWIRIGKSFPCRHLPQLLSSYRLHEASKTIQKETLHLNSEEGLRMTIRHYAWAPLTRVYTACNCLCKARLPSFLAANRTVVIIATIICSLLRSLWLNRGIHRSDLELLNRENFGKLCKSRIEIMTGARDLK